MQSPQPAPSAEPCAWPDRWSASSGVLDKKASTPRKENEANIAIKELIVETLKSLANAVTIDELRNANAEIGALSNQKVSSLMTQLKKENKVVRTENKKKAYFSVAE